MYLSDVLKKIVIDKMFSIYLTYTNFNIIVIWAFCPNAKG